VRGEPRRNGLGVLDGFDGNVRLDLSGCKWSCAKLIGWSLLGLGLGVVYLGT